jgi:hypothetical protein
MAGKANRPICGSEAGNCIDGGTMNRTRSSPPGPAGMAPAGAANLLDAPQTSGCASALRTARQDYSAVKRARSHWSVISAAATAKGIDPALLAAIGVRETGFRNMRQIGGGHGVGVFQIDLGAHPGVTAAQASNLQFAAGYAAGLLAANAAYLRAKFPGLGAAQLLQATAASYNLGRGGISGDPNTIDVGTPHGNYGSNVVGLMSCFKRLPKTAGLDGPAVSVSLP